MNDSMEPRTMKMNDEVPEACVDCVRGARRPEDLLPSRFVTAAIGDEFVTLTFAGQRVVWDKASLRVSLSGPHGEWSFAVPTDALVRQDGKDYRVSLSGASCREFMVEEFGGTCGVKVRLSGFASEGTCLDVKAVLYVAIEWMTGDLKLEFRPEEGSGSWREVHWPGSLACEDTDAAILPFMQGLMIPRDWPDSYVAPCNDGPGYGLAYGRNLYMPWWGYLRGGHGCMFILEDPVDCGIGIDHKAGRGTLLEPWLLHSLGRMGYTRRMRVKTFRGTYVQMARFYRAYLQERGRFVDLKAKIQRTPKLERMIGSAIVHSVINRTSMRDPKFPEGKSVVLTTYEEHIANMRRLKELGFDRLYWHFDGAGYRGYDNFEPDQLPVGESAGGAAGLGKMMGTARELGYLTAYHQQYRDFYLDAPSYSQDLALRSEDGSVPVYDFWDGGKNAVICPIFSPDYVRRNNLALHLLGGDVDGCYLDVFSVVPGDECYHPEHRVSRRRCFDLRRECFEYIKKTWGIISSEEPTAWAVPYLDLVHHAPWAVKYPEKVSYGIRLPLHNLVFHDAILVPFDTEGRRGQGYYYAADDIPYLYGLMNAQMPYVSETPDPDECQRVKFAVEHQRRLQYQEMVDHEVLSKDGYRQKSTFADGTTVIMDQTAAVAEVRYPEGKGVRVVLDGMTGKASFQELD